MHYRVLSLRHTWICNNYVGEKMGKLRSTILVAQCWTNLQKHSIGRRVGNSDQSCHLYVTILEFQFKRKCVNCRNSHFLELAAVLIQKFI
jgi:hypothetical protein